MGSLAISSEVLRPLRSSCQALGSQAAHPFPSSVRLASLLRCSCRLWSIAAFHFDRSGKLRTGRIVFALFVLGACTLLAGRSAACAGFIAGVRFAHGAAAPRFAFSAVAGSVMPLSCTVGCGLCGAVPPSLCGGVSLSKALTTLRSCHRFKFCTHNLRSIRLSRRFRAVTAVPGLSRRPNIEHGWAQL
jgi:hypothetical protein